MDRLTADLRREELRQDYFERIMAFALRETEYRTPYAAIAGLESEYSILSELGDADEWLYRFATSIEPRKYQQKLADHLRQLAIKKIMARDGFAYIVPESGL